MPNHHRWDEVRRELGIDEWRREHPWQHRKMKFRMWLRSWVWRLTRIDIG